VKFNFVSKRAVRESKVKSPSVSSRYTLTRIVIDESIFLSPNIFFRVCLVLVDDECYRSLFFASETVRKNQWIGQVFVSAPEMGMFIHGSVRWLLRISKARLSCEV
jgi:hypothetical protein